jgi:hypothetical protein
MPTITFDFLVLIEITKTQSLFSRRNIFASCCKVVCYSRVLEVYAKSSLFSFFVSIIM